MFKLIVLLCVALVALVAHDASAVHPVAQQVARTEAQDAGRQRFLSHSQRLLTACTNSEAGRKLQEQNAARRSAKLKELLASRRLDATTVSATSHKTNLTGVTTSTYPEYLFGDDDSVKCVLAPETTQDTFYVSGELYRQDITEDQTGVSLSTELQFIDVNTGSFQSNNTYTGGSVVHAGEIFFDQDLITEVEETSTYVSNSQNLTTNEADKGFTEATATGYDPIMEYALIGDSVGDGVFAWISIGVDLTASNNVTAVGALTADGGVQYR
ncbi:hypothetical protein PRNP1_008065 [Phytophthora ramorum]